MNRRPTSRSSDETRNSKEKHAENKAGDAVSRGSHVTVRYVTALLPEFALRCSRSPTGLQTAKAILNSFLSSIFIVFSL